MINKCKKNSIESNLLTALITALYVRKSPSLKTKPLCSFIFWTVLSLSNSQTVWFYSPRKALKRLGGMAGRQIITVPGIVRWKYCHPLGILPYFIYHFTQTNLLYMFYSHSASETLTCSKPRGKVMWLMWEKYIPVAITRLR